MAKRKRRKKQTKLTVEEMHLLLRLGKAKLRPLKHILGKARRGYNKNYIRDWFDFDMFLNRKLGQRIQGV